MRKIKLFKYPHAPGHVHDAIPTYRNSVPFSEDGIEKWTTPASPKDAELFYCGQYSEKNNWMLDPRRFEHFKGNESKHVLDLEGDHSQNFILDWMRPCIMTAMNAEPNHRNWNLMVRPGCSVLLMDMVKNPPALEGPEAHGFFFVGQRDPRGLRQKLRVAFEQAQVPGEFIFRDKWNAPSALDDPEVIEYQQKMSHWAMILCPAGTGQMTVRLFESCMLGKIPIIIADNLLFEDHMSVGVQKSTAASVDELSRWLKRIYEASKIIEEFRINGIKSLGYRRLIQSYFRDPTLYILAWMQRRGLFPGNDFWQEWWNQTFMLATKVKINGCLKQP